MKARFEKSLGHRVVKVIRRDDGHSLDAIRTRGFGARHVRVAAVGAIRRDVQVLRGSTTTSRIGGKRGGYEFVMIVHARGDAVPLANERTGAASHHPQSDAALCFTRGSS